MFGPGVLKRCLFKLPPAESALNAHDTKIGRILIEFVGRSEGVPFIVFAGIVVVDELESLVLIV